MKSYSYSAFKDYNTCQKQFYYVRLMRSIKRTYDGAADGKAFHAVIDAAVKHNETTLPSRFAEYNWVLNRINKIKQKLVEANTSGVTTVNSEMGIGVTAEWEPRPFYHKENWYCGAIDFIMQRGDMAYMTDWKFGKSAYADIDQLYQQSTLAFAALPHIKTIRADLTFVKENVQVPAMPLTINRNELELYKADIFRNAQRIYDKTQLNDPEAWEASPSGLCQKHCPIPKSLCSHSGKVDNPQEHNA